MASFGNGNGSNQYTSAGIPKLNGKINYRAWWFVMDLIIKEAMMTSSKKKKFDEELDIKIQGVIATSVSEQILMSLISCKNSEEMLERIEEMYGPNENDIFELHNKFQNFQYDASKSARKCLPDANDPR